ncbi:contractile injection system protein, VgrG/Pvc8 family [Sphingomonas sp. Leaf38]|uniref:contractile injection system protein, VgrG/Pvc8 family n=1 Tax=Sphingomonas sp. Leaf38 TaxID=1736217 RepID=UPI000701C00A|nr:contractile injection system protein, VgrG/Pvc8 family [Sphingomonas sp. Leaf38]KQN29691.1 late control protein [Sphingomonas sp. Leaf38]
MISNIPDFRITLDGTDLTGTLQQDVAAVDGRIRKRLISLSLSEKRGESADQLDIVLSDADGRLALPKTGAILNVQLGWKQGTDVTPGLVDKGSFKVDEVAHSGPPDVITIRARSVDFTSELKTRREKSWHGTTLGAVVNEIAAHHGLKPSCAPALASITVTAKAQSRESDLAFLRRLGRELDAVATIKSGHLILSRIGEGKTPAGRSLPALTIRRRDGDSHNFSRQKRDDVPGVSATWHDRKGGKRETFTAGKANGARKLSRVYGSEEDASAAANAAHSRVRREPVSLDLSLALGRPDISPEQKTTIFGYKTEIDAVAWVVGEVSHSLGDRGYATKIKLETAR